MEPSYQKAAVMATEILIQYGITSAPVSPLPILKNTPGVLVFTFESISNHVDQDRRCVISMFGQNQDAFTTVNKVGDKKQYIVTYNQQLPQVIIQRSLSRELGHIILGHDGTLPEDVRNEEARAFANHLLVPRPLIHAIRSAGIPRSSQNACIASIVRGVRSDAERITCGTGAPQCGQKFIVSSRKLSQ